MPACVRRNTLPRIAQGPVTCISKRLGRNIAHANHWDQLQHCTKCQWRCQHNTTQREQEGKMRAPSFRPSVHPSARFA
eukprot:3184440-Amphidinium_carterae.1